MFAIIKFYICQYAHLKRQGLVFNYWLSMNGGSALLLLLFQSYSTVAEKGATENNAAMNMGVQTLSNILISILLNRYPEGYWEY